MSSKAYEDLSKLESELYTCTMCGFCKRVCPVFIDDNKDSAAPRGRMTMAYGLISGQLKPDDELRDKLFQCTQCQDCMRRCPSNAACPDVVVAARREMILQGSATPYQEQLVMNVKTTGNIYADHDENISKKSGETPFFVGCQYLSRPNSVKKIVKLLEKLNVDPEIMDESCCGFPLHVMGFKAEAEKQEEKLKDLLANSKDQVITVCPSCLKHIHEKTDTPAVHILQVIDQKLAELTITKPLNAKVTYHDPCDLSRGADITEEPRRILEHIGCELVEMENNRKTSRCCGGGGGILTWDEDLSMRMSIKRISEARATGAEMLVTACPTCEQNLKKGARIEAAENGTKALPIRHILDLLVKASK